MNNEKNLFLILLFLMLAIQSGETLPKHHKIKKLFYDEYRGVWQNIYPYLSQNLCVGFKKKYMMLDCMEGFLAKSIFRPIYTRQKLFFRAFI